MLKTGVKGFVLKRVKICVKNDVRCRYRSTFGTALDAAAKMVMPKVMLENPIYLVANEIQSLTKGIISLVGSGHPVLSRLTNYYIESGGKRLRPMIVLLMSKALSEIPASERDRIKVDYSDIPDDPVYSRNPSSIFFGAPVNNFNPLHILHGIKPLVNPLAGERDLLSEDFDRGNGILPKQRRLAEIVEMIHAASLLHDDVLDHSTSRRGKPSGNSAFTNKMAVLAGDFLLSRANSAVTSIRNHEVSELVSACISNLVEGEFMQLKNTALDPDLTTINNGTQEIPLEPKSATALCHQYRVDIPQGLEVSHEVQVETAFNYYLHKSYLKTAALISKSCRGAAILAGSKEAVLDDCYSFGKNLGICFQLVDDMLDFTVSSAELGKPAGADLELGIATAPVLFAWKEYPALGTIIQRNFSQPGDIERVLEAVEKYDGVTKTKELAREYRDKALKNLRNSLPESDSRSALEFLTNSVLTRRK
ncbi:trans-hexaprenyltranstransferase Ecym_5300 [Eremothecium cymbalariae DBVPG|uniref:Hexaprenyl pyrophosphate synthase, mitochondrial n=1 Tax=Eremothecium cymbalariae (strain CBS 270.75 / DBVPG 7215 / KCTC 17166 / NRRL Y-17582) TaxID=931890 RepID=I6NDC0_ERECY|nr:hypothetical protein Ecym_5300 [Eremothecium cymbalariae DBVPG\